MRRHKGISWWQRFLTRYFRLVIARYVPLEVFKEYGERIMALHYCRVCKRYRFSTCIDPMSKVGRLYCWECSTMRDIKRIRGMCAFRVAEAWTLALDLVQRMKRLPVFLKAPTKFFLFSKFFYFGLGKYTPHDRAYQTLSELEDFALVYLGEIFLLFRSEIFKTGGL